MANFKTHVAGAALAGVFAVSVFTRSAHGLIQLSTFVYIFLAIIGGLLPDVDAENSRSKRIIFTILALVVSCLAIRHIMPKSTNILNYVLWFAITFILVRYLAHYVLSKYSIHRGIFHSIPVMFIWAFAIALFLQFSLQLSSIRVWHVATVVSAGFLSHLLLDELFSVNLSNLKIKKSFGSALKFKTESSAVTLWVYFMVIGLFFMMPKYKI